MFKHYLHSGKLFLAFLSCFLLLLSAWNSYAQIDIKTKKKRLITDGSKLKISKRRKVQIFNSSQKLLQSTSQRQKVTKQTKFAGTKKYKRVKSRKKPTASFRGNIKKRSDGSSYDIAKKFKGNVKVAKANRLDRSAIKKYRGNIAYKKSKKASLIKNRNLYVRAKPQKSNQAAIKKYSGTLVLRKSGRFNKAGSNYRGDIRLKKNRIASRRISRYHGGPTDPLQRTKYRNQLIKNSRKKEGQYGKRPKKRNRKKDKLRYDTREGRIWNN